MYLTDESKIVIQYKHQFINKKVLFSGNIHDQNFLHIISKKIKIHIQKYYHDNISCYKIKKNVCFRMLPRKSFIKDCDIIIFFLIRNKIELIFQLTYICAQLTQNKEIFIVGKNKFGINSICNLFKNWIYFKKISYKKKCALYYGKIKEIPKFSLKEYCKKYVIYNTTIVTLPGIFDYKKLDLGSQLMIHSFNTIHTGKVLDIGSGSGVLSAILKKYSPLVKITLIDNNSTALFCSSYTLRINKMIGRVYYSNIFSNVKDKFDLIITNPPTHYGNLNNLSIIYKIIKESKNFLKKNGKLRIVLHSNISCKKIFIKYFGNYKILKTKKHFNLYEVSTK
ncbi:16S rRNA (guanine(1207)-N(2))-methyltransferase RsmC [Buchnera aphidicola]|uniref:16S rRNA (guanine(1207)-N(2))-methyltransferase RsmC n=1 Tax=Buchnera aphidicola TaxID=9 RepID=UPI0034646D5C